MELVTGSEDFSYLIADRPGAYVFLGQADAPNPSMIHSPTYDFDDKLLPIGVSYWINLVETGAAAVCAVTGIVSSPRGSLAFSGAVGATVPLRRWPRRTGSSMQRRFPSEGYWAFCRFESDAIRPCGWAFNAAASMRDRMRAGPTRLICNCIWK